MNFWRLASVFLEVAGGELFYHLAVIRGASPQKEQKHSSKEGIVEASHAREALVREVACAG